MRFCLEVLLGAVVLGKLSAASMAPSAASGNPRAVWVVKVDTRNGQLVRTLVAPPKPLGADRDMRGLVAEAAKNFDVNPLLVDSVIQVESNYNPFAVSPKGAQGLMQLMPGTAQRFGVTDSFDPKQNIEAGVRYLAYNLGPEGTRVNAISAGPIKTLAAAGIANFRKMLDHVEQNAPLRRSVSRESH